MRIVVSSLALALAVTSCRPPYPSVEPIRTSTPSVLSPLYEAESYKELVEDNWTAIADETPSVTFLEFAEKVEANSLPSEDLEDIYATLFAIASQHAFVQGESLDGRYFLAAAALSCWWHPPGSLPPSTDWISRRPALISDASESGLSRLNFAKSVDTSIYLMKPYDVLELLTTTEAGSFLQSAP